MVAADMPAPAMHPEAALQFVQLKDLPLPLQSSRHFSGEGNGQHPNEY